MALDLKNLSKIAEDYAAKEPSEIIALAIREYAPDVAISFSGAEDVVLVDMAAKIGGNFKVFSLDTGRLHPETYQFLEKVREHYGIPIETYFPQPEAVQKLVREKGLFSFYKDGHKECCGVRKVEPLLRALKPLRAWITGQRRDQSPGTRADVPVVQLDPTFGSRRAEPLVKFNPLANWTSQQVWAYIREQRRAVQRAARARLRLDRLRAVHARRAPGRARARRPLVVGRRDDEGVRPARGQRRKAS